MNTLHEQLAEELKASKNAGTHAWWSEKHHKVEGTIGIYCWGHLGDNFDTRRLTSLSPTTENPAYLEAWPDAQYVGLVQYSHVGMNESPIYTGNPHSATGRAFLGQKLSKMNGLPFQFFTFTDFGQPGRRTAYGRHTTLATAVKHRTRISKYHALRSAKVWTENDQGIVV